MTTSRPVRRIAVAALALALAPTVASARLFWVSASGGPSCTHTTLTDAIDAAQSNPGDDTIHLVGSGPFTGPFSILAGGITIVGGVPSCGSITSTQYATVQAPSGKRPLSILMGQDGRITLRRLVITTNFGTLNSNGGGIWFAGAGPLSEVVLDDSRVVNNGTLQDGGGIFVGRGRVRLTRNSIVSSNTAANGGGIAGINSASVVVDSSVVTANTAYFNGGGIYLQKATVNIGDSGGLGLPAAVANNLAGADGGGIYLRTRAGSSSLGTVALTSISGNQAGRGGGIFLDDAWMLLYQADISLNTASREGGGIYLTSGGSVSTDSSAPQVDGLPRFTQNKSGGQGTAIYADGALSYASLGSGSFNHHDTRAALVAASGNATLSFRGITAFANLAPELFGVEGGASLTVLHASVAGNTLSRIVRWDGSGPGIRFANSVFSETEPFFSGLPPPQVLPRLTCVVSQSPLLLQGMPPGSDLSQVLIADPRFVAPERGDLHVGPTSPAVDLCAYADGFGLNGGYDRDHNFRGFDEPFHPNPANQTHDAGADEVVPIVWDDFESGALSHWHLIEPSVPGSGNNVQITTAARLGPLTSQRGLQLTFVNPAVQTPNNVFVWALPSAVPGTDPTRINGSFFLDPQNLTMSTAAGFNRLPLLTLSERIAKPRLRFDLVRGTADTWSLEVRFWPDTLGGPVVAGSAFFACAATPCGTPADWHNNRIELEWRGGSPAHLTVWRTRYLNGVPNPATRVQMLSLNLTMPGAKIDEVMLGLIGDQSAGTFGQIFFDEVSFTR